MGFSLVPSRLSCLLSRPVLISFILSNPFCLLSLFLVFIRLVWSRFIPFCCVSSLLASSTCASSSLFPFHLLLLSFSSPSTLTPAFFSFSKIGVIAFRAARISLPLGTISQEDNKNPFGSLSPGLSSKP